MAHRPLVTPLLELGDHHDQELDDDLGRDVGHDPEPEDRHPGEGSPREQVDEPEDSGALRRRLEAVHRAQVDAGDGHLRAELVEPDDDQGEDDLVPEVRNLEHVLEASEHRGSSDLARASRRYRLVNALPRAGGRPRP